MAKTLDTILDELSSYLQQKQSSLDLQDGSVVYDELSTFASELSTYYTDLDSNRGILLWDSTYLTSSEIDALASNWGLTRKTATAATGNITFGANTLPTTTITIGATDGSGGVAVSTQTDTSGAVVSFVTTETVYLTPTTSYNSTTGYYEVTAAIQASITGIGGNVGINTITNLPTSISGISVIYNKTSVTNGTDEETDAELLARVKAAITSIDLGTKGGYKTLLLAQPNVTDAYIVGPNDSAAVRGEGGIDIYVITNTLAATTQANTSTSTSVALTSLPAVYTGTAYVIDSGGNTYTEANGDFIITEDTTTVFAGSTESKDYLVWSITPPTTTTTIYYSYNSAIAALQAVVDDEDYHIVPSDVLVKKGTIVNVAISLSISVLAGFNTNTVSTAVSTAIYNYVNALTLEADVTQSSIISLITDIDGVNYVVSPLTKFCRKSSSGVADIVIAANEYARINTTDIIVTTI